MESHSAHSWKRLTRAIVAVVVVAAVAVGVWWLWPKPLDTLHTKVEISASSKFTDAQLDDLVQASYRANAGMKNCSVDKVKYDEEKFRTSERVFRTMIKGLIARDVYADSSAYTRIVNHRNPDLDAALKVLYDRNRYDSLLRNGNPDYERLVKK